MVELAKPKVVITGISGFLGSQVCSHFLNDGSYTVRGTVRDKTNEKKVAPLRAAYGELFNKIELVNADLLDSDSIDKAVQGCEYIVHTASPCPLVQPKNEMDLIRPAVEGTLSVLRAAQKHNVKRVVITSSSVNMVYHKPENEKEEYDEGDWSDVNEANAYSKSKIFAEEVAWNFVNSLPYNKRFELITINPGLIMGPALIAGDFSSAEIIRKLLSGEFPGMPKVQFPIVDVRDVALAHLVALKVPEARFQRFILNSDSLWFKEIAEILKDNYPTLTFKTDEIGYCPMKVASFFLPEVKVALKVWGKKVLLNNNNSKKILQIKYRSPKEAIEEMGKALVKFGIVNVPSPK